MEEKPEIYVSRVKLGSQGLEVSRLGFGCVGLSGTYNASLPHEAGCSIIKEAFSKGITLLDTADLYGVNHDNEIMVGKALKELPRDQIQLATKFGCFKPNGYGQIEVKGTPDYVRECCEASLKRLDVDYIDLYYQHRVDTSVPIEDTMGELKKLVEEGKIKYIGLSEASVDTIRRAHAVHPITAVQMEYSLWAREIEDDIIPLCRELRIGIVAYSPLGRGFFGGKAVVEGLPAESILATHPRFNGENLERNKLIYSHFSNLAAKLACTTPQLALAWLLHHGDNIIPIPGTTKVKNLENNIDSLAQKLTEDNLKEICDAVPIDEVAGHRNYIKMQYVDIDINHSEGSTKGQFDSGSESNHNIYTPQVSDEYKPKMGQQFLSLDEAREFYNAYAKEAGFSVRINSSKRSRDYSEILRKEYVCSKEGTTSTRVNSKRKRRRGLTREGCNAKFTVVKSKSGGYVVKQFVEGHTHSLTSPQRAHLLRSHRSEAKKSLSQQLSTVNILEVQTKAIQSIGCIERDIYKHDRNLCSEMRGHDEELLYEYFLSEQEKNASFIYDIKKDEDDRITHCFWADAKSRRAYNFFGDVVVFDTTYDTNRYDMVFATFIGVNNHCQSVIFGCSFLSDDTIESFMWSFEQFKKSMSGGPPKVIITDQNPTITKAIAHTFPNTVHKYCIWHILNKFSEKLNEVVYRDHYNDFKQCIWDSYSKEEFELKWMEAIGRSMLHDNTWLQSVYEMRAKWVPVFVNHVFSAGLTNSQRVETCHGFFKRYVSKRNSLVDFIICFNRVIAHQRHEELIADHVDINEKPKLKLPHEMENRMAEIYTHKIFYEFQDEFWESFFYNVELATESGSCVYKVYRRNKSGCRGREIVYEKESDYATCNCKKFKSEGIPCRHLLAYFVKMGTSFLPQKYILNRWTKTAKYERVVNDLGIEINHFSDNSFISRRTRLFQLASNVIESVAFSDKDSKIFEDGLSDLLQRFKKDKAITSCGSINDRNSTKEQVYNEPPTVQAEECGERLKDGKEKACDLTKEKGRQCNGCGKVEHDHDKRNCPTLKNRSTVDANEDSNLLDLNNGILPQ